MALLAEYPDRATQEAVLPAGSRGSRRQPVDVHCTPEDYVCRHPPDQTALSFSPLAATSTGRWLLRAQVSDTQQSSLVPLPTT